LHLRSVKLGMIISGCDRLLFESRLFLHQPGVTLRLSFHAGLTTPIPCRFDNFYWSSIGPYPSPVFVLKLQGHFKTIEKCWIQAIMWCAVYQCRDVIRLLPIYRMCGNGCWYCTTPHGTDHNEINMDLGTRENFTSLVCNVSICSMLTPSAICNSHCLF
jgi:hypothetical protein